MVADLGFGLPPGMAVRTSLVATALARSADLGEDDVRDAFYTALLLHVGCVAVAHESAAAFGDDIALNRAVARTNLADPNDIVATFVPEVTRGMAPNMAARARAFALSREVFEWGYRTDTGVCEVARDTARGLGLPSSIQLGLYHVFESWVGGAAPGGLKGDSIPIASRVARVAMEAAFFSHLGGVEASIAAVRARAGVILDPTLAATFVADARNVVGEADRGDPRHRLLEVEPAPVIERDGAERVAVARAFGDLADVKVPFLHGHAKEVTRLALGAARRLGLADAEIAQLGTRRAASRRRPRRRVQCGVGEAGTVDQCGVGAGTDARLLLRADPRRVAVTRCGRDDGGDAPRASRRVGVPPVLGGRGDRDAGAHPGRGGCLRRDGPHPPSPRRPR